MWARLLRAAPGWSLLLVRIMQYLAASDLAALSKVDYSTCGAVADAVTRGRVRLVAVLRQREGGGEEEEEEEAEPTVAHMFFFLSEVNAAAIKDPTSTLFPLLSGHPLHRLQSIIITITCHGVDPFRIQTLSSLPQLTHLTVHTARCRHLDTITPAGSRFAVQRHCSRSQVDGIGTLRTLIYLCCPTPFRYEYDSNDVIIARPFQWPATLRHLRATRKCVYLHAAHLRTLPQLDYLFIQVGCNDGVTAFILSQLLSCLGARATVKCDALHRWYRSDPSITNVRQQSQLQFAPLLADDHGVRQWRDATYLDPDPVNLRPTGTPAAPSMNRRSESSSDDDSSDEDEPDCGAEDDQYDHEVHHVALRTQFAANRLGTGYEFIARVCWIISALGFMLCIVLLVLSVNEEFQKLPCRL